MHGGKLFGVSALGFFFLLIMPMMLIRAYLYTDLRTIMIIVLIIFFVLVSLSIITWKSILKAINFVDINLDKESRKLELNKKFLDDNQYVSKYLENLKLDFSVNTRKRIGITITKYKLSKGRIFIILQHPGGVEWRNNNIEIRGNIFSDTELIKELMKFVDKNIV